MSSAPAPSPSMSPATAMSMAQWLARVETVVVNARVTGQRVEFVDRNFASQSGGGRGPVHLPPEVVSDLLAKNAQTPIVALVIRACKLDALPRELGQLKFLHELDVSGNALVDLPVDLLALTNLAKLNLTGNKFKELPVFLGHLPGLLQLQVTNMPTLTSLPFNVMRNGTEAICAHLRSAFVVIEEKQEELELNVREMLNKDKHSDIVFVVEGQHIYAHRLIVALRIASPVISAMLASPNREHRVAGVGADAFLQLLRFAYGNGVYQLTGNAASDQAFLRMLDDLQITTFGRNQKLPGTRIIVKRADAMLRDDFVRLFNRIANPISGAGASTPPPAPSSPRPCSEPSPQPATEADVEADMEAEARSDVVNSTEEEAAVQQPRPRHRRRQGRQKRETRAERQMREAEERADRDKQLARPTVDDKKTSPRVSTASVYFWVLQSASDLIGWTKTTTDGELTLERQKEQEQEQERQRELEMERERSEQKKKEGTSPLLNEELLLRHALFADLHVQSADDLAPSSDGGDDEHTFACHKFLLCVRSSYFQAKFDSGMADALDKRITIHGFSRDSVVQLLRAVYTDDVEVNADNAQDLLDLSGQYQLERMRSVVEKFFGDLLDHENVLSVLHMADHYQAYHLKLFCTSHVLKHRDAVMAYKDEWRSFRAEHPELFSQLNRLLQA